jgi:hypothetical protein
VKGAGCRHKCRKARRYHSQSTELLSRVWQAALTLVALSITDHECVTASKVVVLTGECGRSMQMQYPFL